MTAAESAPPYHPHILISLIILYGASFPNFVWNDAKIPDTTGGVMFPKCGVKKPYIMSTVPELMLNCESEW